MPAPTLHPTRKRTCAPAAAPASACARARRRPARRRAAPLLATAGCVPLAAPAPHPTGSPARTLRQVCVRVGGAGVVGGREGGARVPTRCRQPSYAPAVTKQPRSISSSTSGSAGARTWEEHERHLPPAAVWQRALLQRRRQQRQQVWVAQPPHHLNLAPHLLHLLPAARQHLFKRVGAARGGGAVRAGRLASQVHKRVAPLGQLAPHAQTPPPQHHLLAACQPPQPRGQAVTQAAQLLGQLGLQVRQLGGHRRPARPGGGAQLLPHAAHRAAAHPPPASTTSRLPCERGGSCGDHGSPRAHARSPAALG